MVRRQNLPHEQGSVPPPDEQAPPAHGPAFSQKNMLTLLEKNMFTLLETKCLRFSIFVLSFFLSFTFPIILFSETATIKVYTSLVDYGTFFFDDDVQMLSYNLKERLRILGQFLLLN